MPITFVLLVLAGLFTIAGGVFNWDWFMGNRRARIFVNVLGRQGARVLYIVLGLFIIGSAFLAMVNGQL